MHVHFASMIQRRMGFSPDSAAPAETDQVMLWWTWGLVAFGAALSLPALHGGHVEIATIGLWGIGGATISYWTSRHWRDVESRVTVVDGRATVHGTRYFGVTLLAVGACFSIPFAVLGATAPGGGGTIVLVFVLAATPVVIAPDALRLALITTGVTFDADSVQLRTYGYELEVDWTEITEVSMDMPAGTGSAVTIFVTPEAAARVRRRRRFLFSFQGASVIPGGFAISSYAVDEPWLLYAQLATLLELDRDARDAYLRAVGPDLLTGHRPVDGYRLGTAARAPYRRP